MQKIDALIMKGGGVKGLALAGAIVELEKHIEFGAFVGTSAGAIASVLLAAGADGAQLERTLREKSFRDFLDGRWWTYAWNLLSRRGLHPGDALAQWLADQLHATLGTKSDTKLSSLPKRAVVYACQRGGREVTFDGLDQNKEVAAHTAARASASIPFFFCTVEHNSRRIYDGGWINNYPVEIFLRQEHEKGRKPTFVALYLGTTKPPPLKAPVIGELLAIPLEGREAELVDRYRDDTIIIDTDPVGTTDFDLTNELKDLLVLRGRVAAQRFLLRRGLVKDPAPLERLEREEREVSKLCARPLERRPVAAPILTAGIAAIISLTSPCLHSKTGTLFIATAAIAVFFTFKSILWRSTGRVSTFASLFLAACSIAASRYYVEHRRADSTCHWAGTVRLAAFPVAGAAISITGSSCETETNASGFYAFSDPDCIPSSLESLRRIEGNLTYKVKGVACAHSEELAEPPLRNSWKLSIGPEGACAVSQNIASNVPDHSEVDGGTDAGFSIVPDEPKPDTRNNDTDGGLDGGFDGGLRTDEADASFLPFDPELAVEPSDGRAFSIETARRELSAHLRYLADNHPAVPNTAEGESALREYCDWYSRTHGRLLSLEIVDSTNIIETARQEYGTTDGVQFIAWLNGGNLMSDRLRLLRLSSDK